MTGRHEEPEPTRDVQWHPPSGPTQSQAVWQLPGEPSGPHPVGGGQSGPHPVDPHGEPGQPDQSGPHAADGAGSGEQQAPLYGEPYNNANPYGENPYAQQPYNENPYSGFGLPRQAPTPGYYDAQGAGYPGGRSEQGGYQQPDPGYGRPAGHQHGGAQPGPQPAGAQHSGAQHSGAQHSAGQHSAGQRQQSPVHDLSSAQLLRQTKRTPQSGWRRALYLASGGTVNLGESGSDVYRRELVTRINQPLHGCYKIAMLSLKGGVGKTTTTTTLGSTFASLRGDRVIAVDANPDRGTLSQKIPLETTATVRHLLRDANRIRRYSDIRSYTSQGPSRLEILASEQDPAVSEAYSEEDYRRTVTLLEHFYNIVLTDCGTGLMHSAMKGVLDLADSLVIVSSGSIDGARSASATLDWLDAHGYRDLVGRSVAVINSVRPTSGKVDLDKVAAHFAARCRAVCRMPFDEHLEEGGEIELDRFSTEARLAALNLAATVADDFPHAVTRSSSR